MAYDPYDSHTAPPVDDSGGRVAAPGGYDPYNPPKPPPTDVTKRSFKTLPSTANGGTSSVWDAIGEGATAEGASYNPVGLARTVVDTVSGNKEVADPSLPWLSMEGLGLSATDPRAYGITGHMVASRDPQALARVIKERVPEAVIEPDSKGQLTVQVPGGPKMYLDRPGFSPQKALFYGGQGAAALASGGRSLLGLGLRGGAQHAASQAGSYTLGGADSPVDLPGTALAAVAPVALGTLGAAAVKGYEYLNSTASRGAAEVADRARQLYRWGFGAKEGDLTRNPAQLAAEDRATNAGAPGAQQHMADFHGFNADRNQQVKRQLVGEISGDVSPGQKVADDYLPTEGDFGSRVNDAIRSHEAALKKSADDAWKKLGDLSTDTAAGRSVSFHPDVSTDVLAKGADTIRRIYGAPRGPNGTWTEQQLGKDGRYAVDAWQGLQQTLRDSGGAPKAFNLGELQDMRQQLANVINDNPGSSVAKAAIQMKRALDDAISTAEKVPGRLSGDKQALLDFRDANAATRAHYDFTAPKDNDAATDYVGQVLREPNYGGERSAQELFGGAGTDAIVGHLYSNMGPKVTGPVRGVAATRSLDGPRKGGAEGAEDKGPTFDYRSTADRASGAARSDTGKLVFTPEMRDQLHDYSGALRTLSASNTPGAPRLNPSGSGYVGILVGELPLGVGRTIEKIRSTRQALRATQRGGEIVDAAQRLEARAQAINARLPPGTPPVPTGAATASDLNIRLPREPNANLLALNDPNNPTYRWQPRAWQLGVPAYRGGGLLGLEELNNQQ
jgi:hypothetical protein